MRVALAQINPTVGDVAGNAERVAGAIAQACEARADLVVVPELCLCGYPPRDLLLEEGFVEACGREAQRVGEQTTGDVTAVIGVPRVVDEDGTWPGRPRRIANAVLVYRGGRRIAHHDKRLLPTYDVFDEDRYFVPGDRAVVVPVAGHRVGLSICEDLWRGEDVGFAWRYEAAPDPVQALADAGATFIVSPSASPFLLGKGARHRALLRRHAVAHRWHVASVNQVGGNDELIFDGHAAVFDPRGQLVAAAPGFVEHVLIVEVPDPGTPVPDRAPVEDPLLAAAEEDLLFRALVLGIRDYCRKTGFSSVVLGLSGGIDSSVVAALACAALGSDHVTGLIMPGRYSSDHSRRDALDLARRLGVRTVTISIEPPFEAFHAALDPVFQGLGLMPLGASLPDVAEENIQARIRGVYQMAWSNRTGSLLLTTGNKSELAVGYATLYGDMAGGLAPISDVSKQQVYRLARWMNANWRTCGFAGPPIPQPCLDKPPSAELRPGQTDQDTLPPYEVLDAILERFIERRESPARIARETGLARETVRQVVAMVRRAEYKRRQAAPGLKVTSVAFGTGRRMPIAQGWHAP